MRTIFLFIAMFSLMHVNAQETDWKLWKSKDGMDFYTREAENTNFKELKVYFTIESTSICEIISIFLDTENYSSWNYKCVESRKLERISSTDSYGYYLFDFPWPTQDRELISRSTLTQDPSTHVITLKNQGYNVYEGIPEDGSKVRVLDHYNQWTVTPMEGGGVHFEYYLKSSPGGNIPAWLANVVFDTGPYNTMKGLLRVVKEGKYKDRHPEWLVERH